MKRFEEDSDLIAQAAAGAAWAGPADRLQALTGVFETCGDLAFKYPDPVAVAEALVAQAVFAFRMERAEILDAGTADEVLQVAALGAAHDG